MNTKSSCVWCHNSLLTLSSMFTYKVTKLFCRIHLMVVVHSSSRRDATQRSGAVVQAGNQDRSGSRIYKFLEPWVHEGILQYFYPPVSQCQYVEADPNIKSYEIIYRSVIERSTKTPYRFKFSDPVHIITGIACVPKDATTSSPECQVVAGGIGFKEVEIVLKPVQRGDWCCCVQINGIADNCLEMDGVPDQLTVQN